MDKARLRQNILNGEQDIDALSDGLHSQMISQPLQQQNKQKFQPAYLQQQQQFYNNQQPHAQAQAQSHTFSLNSASTMGNGNGNGNYNYEFSNGGTPYTSNASISPPQFQQQVPMQAASSRKSSLTSQSQSNINKFFRRTKNQPLFDDETGADIQDLTSGNVSFDDITHIRNRGPYGISKSLDTTPIIPTLSSNNPNPAKASNNIQYRKQMNQQKKMAMLNGARANSFANGINPMNQGQPQAQNPQTPQDPRFLTMNYPRTMSLQSNGGSARNMSMQNRQNPMYINHQQQMGNNPRAMSLRTGGPIPMQNYPQQQYHPQQMNGGPRSMSLMNNNNGYLPQQQQQFQNYPNQYQQQPYNPNEQYPRTKSLGGYNTFNQQQQQQQQPLRSQNIIRGDPQVYIQQLSQQQNQALQPQVPHPVYDQSFNSSDSLKDVPEEKEDEISNKRDNEDDENDVIYKFDNEDAATASNLSRKSTIKKNNSMKVRKLNLFSNNNASNDSNNTSTSSTSARRKPPPISPIEQTHKEKEMPEQEPDLNEVESNSTSSSQSFNTVDSSRRITTSNRTLDSDFPFPTADIKAVNENDNYEKPTIQQQRQVSTSPSLAESQSSYKLRENTAFNNFKSNYQEMTPSVNESSSSSNYDTSTIASKQQQQPQQQQPITKRSTSISSQLSSKLSRKSSDKPSFFKRLSFSSKKKEEQQQLQEDQSSYVSSSSNEDVKSLQAELSLISKEFASSIRREISLEQMLKNKSIQKLHLDELVKITNQSQIISDLENKLTHQRTINMNRDASKTQIYEELLEKNDRLTEMQERVNELTIEKQKNVDLLNKFESLELGKENNDVEIYVNEIKYLKNQKNELIETVNKLKMELDVSNKKNEKLMEKKLGGNGNNNNKVSGFTIVSPNRKSFLVNE
ncbi:unnamed protein product [Candida verbasci]|uniref:Uncharacterized protein n=1 Tax=Candida verbasci TaxID=1227364 RepID=A0A9W4TVE1_9ASCO|nr:unnamed protein product [Candida verbasci]